MNQVSIGDYMQIKNIEILWLIEIAVKWFKMYGSICNFTYS